jgi:DNA-binding NtrC family response regulator
MYNAEVMLTMVAGSRTAQTSADSRPTIFDMMGQSLSVHQIGRKIQQVASTNFTVILEGETGTGKELVARFIHEYSHRANRPFFTVDCGAIPETLFESELFGYTKGAFTGAEGKKAGYFELARGGTLFLDEIANLSPSLQTKLLRSVQERCISPLGSEKSVSTDVRIIAASNVVLEDEVRLGHFRADLFHRLNEFKIYLLALRQRREDVLFLADRFRREANQELDKNVSSFSPAAQIYLQTYDWPGNVRELRNAVRRAVLLTDKIVEQKHLSQALLAENRVPTDRMDLPIMAMRQGCGLHEIVSQMSGEVEKAIIQHVLQQTGGNKSRAAKLLKIGYKTLHRKLKAYALL